MLYYLQQRKGNTKQDDTATEKKKKKEIDPFDSNEFDESANLNDIEDYMEMLYEDTALKIKGIIRVIDILVTIMLLLNSVLSFLSWPVFFPV